MTGKPFSHAGVVRYGGQIMTVIPHQSACLRCVIGESEIDEGQQSCAEVGVLSAIVGLFGVLQALEAIKYLSQSGELLANSVLFIDGSTMNFRKISVSRKADCKVCGSQPVTKQ
jgi:molybdopterin/thiamine biosynthesis adenylyltransferase